MTASAIRIPQRHFCQNNCPHPEAHPTAAAALSSLRGLAGDEVGVDWAGGAEAGASAAGAAAARQSLAVGWMTSGLDVEGGCGGIVVVFLAGIEDTPRSFSAILGTSRSSGVQYWRNNQHWQE